MWWSKGSDPASGPPGPGSNLSPGPPYSVVRGAADHTVILYNIGFKLHSIDLIEHQVNEKQTKFIGITFFK